MRPGFVGCAVIGFVSVSDAQFDRPSLIRTEVSLAGMLTELADGLVLRHTADSRHRLADSNVIAILADGTQAASAVVGTVRRRIAVAKDGRAGHVDSDGNLVWGRSQKLIIRPDQLWQLPAGTQRVQVIIGVCLRASGPQAESPRIELFDLECAPDQQVEFMMTSELVEAHVDGSATSASGLDALPRRLL
jgi:hypothetical protein